MNNWVGLSLSVPPEFDAQWAIWTTIEVQCFKDFISVLNIKNSSEFHWSGSSVDIFQCVCNVTEFAQFSSLYLFSQSAVSAPTPGPGHSQSSVTLNFPPPGPWPRSQLSLGRQHKYTRHGRNTNIPHTRIMNESARNSLKNVTP